MERARQAFALPKKGKLLTFTTVYNLPPDFNVGKLGLGIVELENGSLLPLSSRP